LADDDPARTLLPLDGLFPKLFGEMVHDESEKGTETIPPALTEAVAAAQPVQPGLQGAAKLSDRLVMPLPLTRPMEGRVALVRLAILLPAMQREQAHEAPATKLPAAPGPAEPYSARLPPAASDQL